VRHETFIAPEPMSAGPGKSVAIRRPGQALIEPARRRAAGEGDGKDAVLPLRRCEKPIRHAARQRVGIGEDFKFGFGGTRHAAIERRTSFRTALAKPSLSLLSVTALASAFT